MFAIGPYDLPDDAVIAPLPNSRGAIGYPPTTVAAYRTERFARTAGGDAL